TGRASRGFTWRARSRCRIPRSSRGDEASGVPEAPEAFLRSKGGSMAQVESRNRATSSEEARRAVLRRIEEEGVEFALLWFTDIEGHLKSFAITPSEIEDALDDGMGFDGC